MISNKYNPLKFFKTDKSNKNKLNTYTILYKVILLVILLIVGVIICNYIYHKLNNPLVTFNIKPENLLVNNLIYNKEYDVLQVPSGNQFLEGFNNSKNIENFETKTTKANTPAFLKIEDADAERRFFNLDAGDQQKLCSNKSDKVIGYRNAITGASFRFQKVDPTETDDNAKYFLLGSINTGKVVEIDNKDNLSLQTKSSTNNNQHFVRINTSDHYYFIPVNDTNNTTKRALQYEYEHLSLRLTKSNEPYEGQKFVKMNDSEQSNINRQAISYGISPAHLDADDLALNKPVSYVFVSPNSASGSDIQQQLAQQTSQGSNNNELKEAVDKVLNAFDEYKQQQQQNENNNILGNEPLKINLNYFDGDIPNNMSSSSFIDIPSNKISNFESFNNLRGVNTKDDVINRLNRYLANNSNNSINLSDGISSANNYSNKLKLAVSGSSLRACPLVDSSEYITKRQLSRCYGCNPDSSLQ